MKIHLQETNAIVSHNNQSIAWEVKLYEWARQKPSNLGYEEDGILPDPFQQLNLYWSSLTPNKQDQIFAAYSQIYQVFEDSQSFEDLIYDLRPKVQQLLDLHPHNEVSYWVRVASSIRPSKSKVYETMEENMKVSEQFGGQEWPRQSQYLSDDYWELIILVLTLRTMYPIWGLFMSRARAGDFVQADLKEFWAMKIMHKSSIEQSGAFKHLMGYISHFVPEEKMVKGAAAGLVPTEDFVQWVAAQTIIRRLSLVNFSGRNEQFSLVASVWSYVRNLMNTCEKTIAETIKDKNPEGGGTDNNKDNRSSNLELIKIKEALTSGAVVELNEYCAGEANTVKIARMFCPDIPDNIIAGAAIATNKLRNKMIYPPQVTLLQLAVSKEVPGNPRQLDNPDDVEWECVFPPRGVMYLEKEQLLSLMTAAVAALWWRKHYDLAALLCAGVQIGSEVAEGGSAENSAPLTKENRERMLELFPHTPRAHGKQAYEFTRASKMTCEAIQSIDLLRAELVKRDWVLTLPNPWVLQIPGYSGNRRFPVRADIKNRIAELSIAIATRSF